MGFIQESRDELQRTKDDAETKGEELEVCRQQSAELEMRLGTVQVMGRGYRLRNRACIVCHRSLSPAPKGSSHLLSLATPAVAFRGGNKEPAENN